MTVYNDQRAAYSVGIAVAAIFLIVGVLGLLVQGFSSPFLLGFWSVWVGLALLLLILLHEPVCRSTMCAERRAHFVTPKHGAPS